MSSGINLRVLWTWDHVAQWSALRGGSHDWGAGNEYDRTAEDFVAEYGRLLRWCGANGLEAVVIWGMLRDNHGGVEAATRVCEIGKECGVKVLAGIGLNAYGGAYYEGNSPWSLTNHLQAHPELFALNEAGEPHILKVSGNSPQPFLHACPSRPENQEYCAESLRWLMENVPLDGVQVEAGDTFVCHCPLCKERRQYGVSALSWEDMALVYPLAAEAVWSVRPEAMVLLETYSHPEPVSGDPVPGFGGGSPPWAAECLAQFPRGAHVQWVSDSYAPPLGNLEWTAAARAPEGFAGQIMRCHLATWWRGRGDEVAIHWLATMVQRSLASGFDGFSMFGDKSPFLTGNELNYLAMANLGSPANPTADLDRFLTDVAAPLLGGPEAARRYLYLAQSLVDEPERLVASVAEARQEAARHDDRVGERWTWLSWYLSRAKYDLAE